MKCICIKNFPNTVKRVTNLEAIKLVEEDNYEYVPKYLWKNLVRDQQKSKSNKE